MRRLVSEMPVSVRLIVLLATGLMLAGLVLDWPGAVGPLSFQLATTIAGVILGLPAAFWLAQRQQRTDQATREIEDTRRRNHAAFELLDVMERDLDDISNELVARRAGTVQRELLVPFLGSNLLEHLGGDRLSVIADPVTIREISRAYDRIATTRFLERTLYQLGNDSFAGAAAVAHSHPVMTQLIVQDKFTKASIDVALSVIQLYRQTHPIDPVTSDPPTIS